MAVQQPDPFAWARMFYQDMANQRDNALNMHDNALMNIFREEVTRQRPYVTMPAELAQAEFNRRNALPYALAEEDRAFNRWKEQRRFQQQLDIEEALAIQESGGLVPGMPGTITIGGKTFRNPNVPVAEEE